MIREKSLEVLEVKLLHLMCCKALCLLVVLDCERGDFLASYIRLENTIGALQCTLVDSFE